MRTRDEYRSSRALVIIGAALDYFISIAVSGVYLAKITSYIGISDSLTGILSSFLSLGCGFQLIAIFLAHKQPVKRWVTTVYIISEGIFAFLYLIPLFNISKTVKTVIFVLMLLSAHVMKNIIGPSRSNWTISLVEDNKRGRFTATCEMVSLVSGMAFSYIMGSLVDKFEAENNIEGAFITGGIALFVITILLSSTLIFSKEKPTEVEKRPILAEVRVVLSEKRLLKVMFLIVLWSIVSNIAIPFMGTYQTKELGFSTTYASVIIMIGFLSRAICSRPMGKFADKFSFAKMLIICYTAEIMAFAIGVFIVPSNGKVTYVLYYLFYLIGMAGINSAGSNLIYDCVEEKNRVIALAISQTISGFAGFFTTLIVSPVVSHIQKNGNKFFGIDVYAQQVLSLISFVGMCGIMIYLLTVVIKTKKDKI